MRPHRRDVSRSRILPLVALLAACSGNPDGNGAAGESSASGSAGGAGNANGTGTTGATTGGSPGTVTGPVAAESEVRRLSRSELDNTLSSLLGDDTGAATRTLSEDEFSPYDNDYTLQRASAALIDSLEAMAGDVAARVAQSESFRASLPCAPSNTADAGCFREIAESLLARGFRRPVADAEIEPYLGLLDFANEEVSGRTIDFYTSVELLIRSILQDPEFLYRIEVGTPTQTPGIVALDDYEIASRLSYLLWGDMPDTELFDKASAAALADASGRRAAARTMLDSDKSRTQLERFFAMWLGYRAIPHPAELTQAFARETNALIERVVFDEQDSALSLFTYPETYLDTFLAEHYGLPAPAGGEGWVDYGDSGRAGLLSHGSVLSAFSKFSDTSPTQRGILVRTRLMCDVVPSPPANVNTDEPPSGTEATCKVDRYETHRANAACATCHSALDPIGFGLENYDMAGRFRTTDDGNADCAIDGQGTVEPYGDFSGPAELGRLLVDNGEIDDCMVRQYLSFAFGRPLVDGDAAQVAATLDDFRSADHRLTELLLDYIESPAFVLRREPVR